jgi:hypothetical protein
VTGSDRSSSSQTHTSAATIQYFARYANLHLS